MDEDQKIEEKLHSFISEQIEALRLLGDNKLFIPYLMITYTIMDIFADITGDHVRDKYIGKRFEAFATKYLMKHLSDVTTDDLWGARCGLLHTGTPESDKSRNGVARQILYSWGAADISLVKKLAAKEGKPKYVALSIDSLSIALIKALEDILTEIENDHHLRTKYGSKIKKFYANVGSRPE